MKHKSIVIKASMLTGLVLLMIVPCIGPAAQASDWAIPEPGQPVPDFELPGMAGVNRSLADFSGKYIVLEWVNFECRHVRQYYDSGTMQKTQTALAGKGVVWLSVCSAATGEDGYFAPDSLALQLAAVGSRALDYLQDTEGRAARSYGVRATPTVVLIDPDGNLVYSGAVDGHPKDDSSETVAHLVQAYETHKAGRRLAADMPPATGCPLAHTAEKAQPAGSQGHSKD
ncbi:MAG: redoxin domain-containing protein [candidate division Zixibacteria bacterium]|nr:redoxin domain-containing protein [candidate division Zixibacteria bacterium]